MIQKIIQVGNSAAVTLPQEFLKKSGWKVGDRVYVEGNPSMKLMLVKDTSMPEKTTLTPEFKEWLDDFTIRNRELLQELARMPKHG